MSLAEPTTHGGEKPLLDLLSDFIVELRKAGLPVSLTENLDAMEAVTHIPIEDREAFKYALGATLVKNHAHWKAFEVVFEVYFSLRGPEYDVIREGDDAVPGEDGEFAPGEGQQPQGGGGGMQSLTPEQLAEMLFKALMNGDASMLAALARQAVTRFAGMEPGRPVGGTYYLYRTLRNLELDDLLAHESNDEHRFPLPPKLLGQALTGGCRVFDDDKTHFDEVTSAFSENILEMPNKNVLIWL